MSCCCWGALREATVKLVFLSERRYFHRGRFLPKEFTVFPAHGSGWRETAREHQLTLIVL